MPAKLTITRRYQPDLERQVRALRILLGTPPIPLPPRPPQTPKPAPRPRPDEEAA